MLIVFLESYKEYYKAVCDLDDILDFIFKSSLYIYYFYLDTNKYFIHEPHNPKCFNSCQLFVIL